MHRDCGLAVRVSGGRFRRVVLVVFLAHRERGRPPTSLRLGEEVRQQQRLVVGGAAAAAVHEPAEHRPLQPALGSQQAAEEGSHAHAAQALLEERRQHEVAAGFVAGPALGPGLLGLAGLRRHLLGGGQQAADEAADEELPLQAPQLRLCGLRLDLVPQIHLEQCDEQGAVLGGACSHRLQPGPVRGHVEEPGQLRAHGTPRRHHARYHPASASLSCANHLRQAVLAGRAGPAGQVGGGAGQQGLVHHVQVGQREVRVPVRVARVEAHRPGDPGPPLLARRLQHVRQAVDGGSLHEALQQPRHQLRVLSPGHTSRAMNELQSMHVDLNVVV
mmetsp:Transcript_32517/g.46894  ORF Transcript_32517/g.46894 Transcript_32517/m.46894 type:complete len:331 (+) Transcript_32517:1541-2533(+)